MFATGVSIPGKPQIGEIHTARISIASLFGCESNFDSNTGGSSKCQSSSSSSSCSSKKSEDRPQKRPCVIWRIIPTIQVLVMTRFDNANVADPNVCLFNNLSHEYVLKRLVAVFPKTPYGGRRSICVSTKTPGVPVKTTDTNVILIPVSVPKKWKCQTVHEYFAHDELNYLNDLLRQINIEDSVEQAQAIQSIVYSQLPSAVNDDAHQQEDNDSSATSSSLPKVRSEFLDIITYPKHDYVVEWLDHVPVGRADRRQSFDSMIDEEHFCN